MTTLKKSIRKAPFGNACNGYVIIPKGHFLYGMRHIDIGTAFNINVHGRLTYSGKEGSNWVIGYDTLHGYSTEKDQCKEGVNKQLSELINEINAIELILKTYKI